MKIDKKNKGTMSLPNGIKAIALRNLQPIFDC